MPRHKEVSSESEDETPHKVVPKTNADGLPLIRDISWVDSKKFEPKKVVLGDEEESGGVARVQIKYKYEKSGEQIFCLVPCKNLEAFLKSNGVEEETYLKKNGIRTGTGKNVMKFYLDKDNEQHQALYESLLEMCAVVKKKLTKKSKGSVDVKIRGLYNTINDKKEVTGYAISARLIESKKGDVYTSAYNDDGQVNVKSVGRCVARPALVFSYVVPEDGESYRINASVGQVYYKAQSLFPLRDRD